MSRGGGIQADFNAIMGNTAPGDFSDNATQTVHKGTYDTTPGAPSWYMQLPVITIRQRNAGDALAVLGMMKRYLDQQGAPADERVYRMPSWAYRLAGMPAGVISDSAPYGQGVAWCYHESARKSLPGRSKIMQVVRPEWLFSARVSVDRKTSA